jgi:hypothetical protein
LLGIPNYNPSHGSLPCNIHYNINFSIESRLHGRERFSQILVTENDYNTMREVKGEREVRGLVYNQVER